MISSVSSGMQMSKMQSQVTQVKISEDQKQQLQSVLEDFSVDNLNSEDATSIVESIKELGISPGRELETLLAESGFDAKSIGDMAGVGESKMPPPPPPQSSGENATEMVNFLEQLLEEYDGELSSENKDSIIAAVQEKFGITDIDSLVSVQV